MLNSKTLHEELQRAMELYVGQMCHRIALMVQMSKRKHPEASVALEELAGWIKGYSMVFSPGSASHPASLSSPTESVIRVREENEGKLAHRLTEYLTNYRNSPEGKAEKAAIRDAFAEAQEVLRKHQAERIQYNQDCKEGKAQKREPKPRGRKMGEETKKILELLSCNYTPKLVAEIMGKHESYVRTLKQRYPERLAELVLARGGKVDAEA